MKIDKLHDFQFGRNKNKGERKSCCDLHQWRENERDSELCC